MSRRFPALARLERDIYQQVVAETTAAVAAQHRELKPRVEQAIDDAYLVARLMQRVFPSLAAEDAAFFVTLPESATRLFEAATLEGQIRGIDCGRRAAADLIALLDGTEDESQ